MNDPLPRPVVLQKVPLGVHRINGGPVRAYWRYWYANGDSRILSTNIEEQDWQEIMNPYALLAEDAKRLGVI